MMDDVAIIMILIVLVAIYTICFLAYDILKGIRKEIRNLRCSMLAEFRALHGITDDMKDIPIRDLRMWNELSEKASKDGDSDAVD